MKIHNAILELGKRLGYGSIGTLSGVCHGFTMRWIEASLLNQQDKFNDRILNKILTALNDDDRLEKIELVKQKVRDTPVGTKPVLTDEEFSWLDLLAFYDSMLLYHAPHEHRAIYGGIVLQNEISRTSQLVGSDEICSQGGLSNVYSVVGIYNKDEIKQHLNQLALGIKSASLGDHEPIAVSLSGNNHAMGLSYYASSNKWVLKDINQIATIQTDNLEIDDVVNRIFDGFRLVKLSERGNRSINRTEEGKKEDKQEVKQEGKREDIQFDEDDIDRIRFVDRQVNLLNNHEDRFSVSHPASPVVITFCKTEQGFWQIEGEEPTAIPLDAQSTASYNTRLANKAYNLVYLSSPYVVLETNVISSAVIKTDHLTACLKDKAPQQEPTEEIIKRKGIDELAYKAASNGLIDILTKLIHLGVPMDNAIEQSGETPLTISCQIGQANVVSLLLDQWYVDVNRGRRDDGATPLLLASYLGHVDVVDVLLKCEYIQINKARTTDGVTSLCAAVANNHADVVSRLLTAKADPNCVMKNGMTPLLIAVMNNNANLIDMLLNKEQPLRVNVDQGRKDDGMSPLHYAAQEGNLDTVTKLLEQGATVDNPMKNGITPLDMARQKGHTEIVDLLIKRAAEINQGNVTPSQETTKNNDQRSRINTLKLVDPAISDKMKATKSRLIKMKAETEPPKTVPLNRLPPHEETPNAFVRLGQWFSSTVLGQSSAPKAVNRLPTQHLTDSAALHERYMSDLASSRYLFTHNWEQQMKPEQSSTFFKPERNLVQMLYAARTSQNPLPSDNEAHTDEKNEDNNTAPRLY